MTIGEVVTIRRKELGLTSLKYQTLDNLIKAIGLPKERVCTYCYDGCDPTAGCACKNCPKKAKAKGKSSK